MRTFLLAVFLCLQLTAFAQTEISRTVMDAQGQPMPGAIVTCLDSQEKLLRGTVTDESGTFSIQVNFDAQEWLRVSFLGYGDQDYHNLAALPDTIVLKERAEELGEVVVQGKSIVTQKTDRLIFHIANENLTKGNSTFQLLSFTPLIKVDNDEIRIIGKGGMQLYVNDRKSLLSGEALQAYLKSLPAETIESIEIITAPGSEYRTGANEGIINLVLKKDETVGWKGSLTLQDEQGYYNNPSGNLYLNYRRGKDALSITASARMSKSRSDNESRYDYLSSGVSNLLEGITRNDRRHYTMNAIWDHQINDRQVFGMMANVSYLQIDNGGHSITRIQKPSVPDSIIYMPIANETDYLQATGNANYRLTTDDKGSKLKLDVDFTRTGRGNDADLRYSDMKDGVVASPYLQQRQDMDYTYSTWSGAVAYDHVFSDAHQLKVGTDFYFLKGNNDFFHGELEGTEYVRDPSLSSDYDMTEKYGGVYVSSDNQWSDKFSTSVGVRAEYLRRTSKDNASGQEVKDNDFAVLPTVSVNYAPNDAHSLSLSFDMYRNRPVLSTLSPGRQDQSPTIYHENNPDLKSVYGYSGSLMYVCKQHYIFGVNYIGGPMMTDFRQTVDGEYTRIRHETFGHQHFTSLTFSWNDSFFENSLSVNANCMGTWARAYGTLEDLHVDMNHFQLMTSLTANYALPFIKQTNVGVSGLYWTPRAEPNIKRSEVYGLNVWIQKRFKHDIAIKVGANDLIIRKSETTYTGTNYQGISKSDYHPRSFYVQLTIPFGRKKVSGAQWHSGSSSKGKSRL